VRVQRRSRQAVKSRTTAETKRVVQKTIAIETATETVAAAATVTATVT
jgi:hypothetical protein